VANELILVVEDNDKNLKLARDLLGLNGFRVLEAITGQQGLQPAAEHRPDLILMDIQLPDVDGVAVLGQLRTGPRTLNIPVVALTAFAMKEDRNRFLSAGFDGYIAKPIDIRTFSDQVGSFLRAGAQASADRASGDAT
jgi:two-component system cell cycle response regulator DivK